MSAALTAYDLALVSGGFGIAGALLGAVVTYRLAIKLTDAQAAHARALADRQAFIAARDRLRAAFAPTLGQIYLAQNHGSTHERPSIDAFVKERLLDYAAAVEGFRPYVSPKDEAGYQDAWDAYHYFAKDSIHATAADWTDELDGGGTLEQRIKAILAYAKT